MIGALSVYAATRNSLVAGGRPGTAYLKRDLINLAVGLVMAAPVLWVGLRRLRAFAPILYAVNCLFLVLVLSPLGSTVNGAHAWLSFGPVQLEPSEFMTGVALLVGYLAATLHLLKPYQEQRFTAFTSDHPASTSTGYQIQQSLIAIGSGGLTGQGFLAGSQTDGGFVPEQQTDFVFTVAAEEGGFVGSSVLLAALGVLLWRGLTIAQNAQDLYGRVVAGCIVAWFGFQAFANFGMTLGTMPVTGSPAALRVLRRVRPVRGPARSGPAARHLPGPRP
ncbi:MAG: rod shape-determining protein RodA [Frankiales bacterium]|nr:rod shape-determining protein RodA [Frankiales bacterium]